MANVNNPSGFKCVKHGCLRKYALKSGNSAIPMGAMVALSGDGVDLWSSGAFIGVAAESKDASDGTYIMVYDNPHAEFVCQTDDGTGTATSIACVGLNITVVGNSSSNALTGLSIAELDESSAATTSTLPWKILGLYDLVGNSYGEFNLLRVAPNNHQLKGGTGTAGV